MTVLTLQDITLRVAGRTLLDLGSLAVDPGRKIGLVGRNGAGKSTLFRAITGQIEPDGGTIRLAQRARMGYVAQEAPAGPTNLLDTVLAADLERSALLRELETATAERNAEIHDRLQAIGADAAPSRAATVLAGLGFDMAAQMRPVGEYSGGWRMRVALAQALFLEPDLLLLDEPTNHLDLEAALWLETWLLKFGGAVLLISHDRFLLERITDGIVHLDQQKLTFYQGNFANFVRVRAERKAQTLASNAKLSAERAHMQSFVDRFKAQASKARQAQSRIKALEKLGSEETVIEDVVTRFEFPVPAELAPPMLTMNNAATGYAGHQILNGVSLRLDQEDRIALLGANGNGKSTLAKLFAGRLPVMQGDVFRNPKMKVGYFAQHQAEELNLDGTPLTHMQEALPTATVTACRAQLARFGLDQDRANTKVGALSGGEKARLLLALTTREAPQLLILDEPTNHLDIDARDALVKALTAYQGAVLLITHDPQLVELVADRLWLVDGGTVKPFDGDLDEYRAFLAEKARGGPRLAAAPRKDDKRERAEKRASLAPMQQKLKQLEGDLAKLESEQKMLTRALADPKLYASGNSALITKATARQKAVAREMTGLEAAWLELSEKLERLAA
ncbi:MAG: ABC-F family ATP-binding cassette domain-containing protein [Rubritepida sp.]|nr:ABC-F family ATP-binding cassette domain-containing protein [Rubritepida sp.]